MNMALLGKTTQPANYQGAKALDTGSTAMVVAVLPGTRAFKQERLLAAANLARRVETGQKQMPMDQRLDCRLRQPHVHQVCDGATIVGSPVLEILETTSHFN
jgi:hypothetical protein